MRPRRWLACRTSGKRVPGPDGVRYPYVAKIQSAASNSCVWNYGNSFPSGPWGEAPALQAWESCHGSKCTFGILSRTRQVLESLAQGAPEARLTREAKASLGLLAKRSMAQP